MIPSLWDDAERDRWAVVLDTWGQYCDKIAFFVDRRPHSPDPAPEEWVSPQGHAAEVVWLGTTRTGRLSIWEKYWRMMLHAARHSLHAAGWFVKLDPDTFFMTGHLKHHLRAHHLVSSEPNFVGHVLRHDDQTVEYVAGSMSALSVAGLAAVLVQLEAAEATAGPELGKLVMRPRDDAVCVDGAGVEENQMAQCLSLVGVHARDLFGEQNRSTVMLNEPVWHLTTDFPAEGEEIWWYFKNNPQTHYGQDCCSTRPISFHYVDKAHMLELYAFIHPASSQPPPKAPQWIEKERVVLGYFNRVREDAIWNTPAPDAHLSAA